MTMRFQNLKIGKRELVKPSWDSGCYAEERDKNGWWRWCSGTAQIVLSNRTDRPAPVSISMKFSAPQTAAVRIEGPGFDVRETAGPAAAEFRQAVMAPPGESRIKLTSDGKKLAAPADPRTMVFQVRDFRMHAAQ